jgi:glyoxylate/hydroxypyruvate reductase A
MKVVVAGDLPPCELHAWMQALRRCGPGHDWLTADDALPRAAQIDAAVVANPAPGALQSFGRLRLVQSLWAGVDRLLADPTLPAGVPLARMVDPAMTQAMVETALWAVLGLHRGYFAYARRQREGRWQVHAQRRAGDIRVLVLGQGEMGRAVAGQLVALGYAVTGWSRRARDPACGVAAAAGDDGLRQALPTADIVVNLLPLTPATRGLVDARFLAALPPKASLVNLARGAHVVDDDLLFALDRGHLRHAVLDVFTTEPLPPGHRYWTHPRVTVLPHAAALTDPATACRVAVDNIDALARDAPLRHLVDRGAGY